MKPTLYPERVSYSPSTKLGQDHEVIDRMVREGYLSPAEIREGVHKTLSNVTNERLSTNNHDRLKAYQAIEQIRGYTSLPFETDEDMMRFAYVLQDMLDILVFNLDTRDMIVQGALWAVKDPRTSKNQRESYFDAFYHISLTLAEYGIPRDEIQKHLNEAFRDSDPKRIN